MLVDPMMTFDLIALVAQTPVPPEDTTTKVLVAALSAGGLGAIITSVIAAFVSRRKLGAEATEIITKAAAGVVTNLQDENARQAKRLEDLVTQHREESKQLVKTHTLEADHLERKMNAMAEAHVQEREEWKRVLQLHVAWDAIAIGEMAKVGIDLPPAPPVSPAQRFVDEHGFPRVTLPYHGDDRETLGGPHGDHPVR